MRGSVLIVDDDQRLSELVAEVLGDEGVNFEVSDTQPAVIARLEPDVVLVDGGEDVDYAYFMGETQSGCMSGVGRTR